MKRPNLSDGPPTPAGERVPEGSASLGRSLTRSGHRPDADEHPISGRARSASNDAPPARVARPEAGESVERPLEGPEKTPQWAIALILTMWVLELFEPEWFLARFGGQGLFTRLPTLLTPILLIAIGLRWRREAFYGPHWVIMLIHLVHWPFAENRGVLIGGFKLYYHYVFMFMGTVCLMTHASRILWLLRAFMLCFAWFAVQGALSGMVSWHTALSNPDSYGPFMCMSVGYSYYYGMAVKKGMIRWLSFAVALLSIVGVVASIARGAVLATAVVLFLIWLRSPRKLATGLAGVVAALVIGGAIVVTLPSGEFTKEMSTVTEGTSSGTSMERWVMWGVAFDVWKKYPILGVGPNNIGPVASKVMPYDETRPQYQDPVVFYGKKLHNIYIEILSETGVVGATTWIVMITGYFQRLRRLRRPDAVVAWATMTKNVVDLHAISLGLECAMVGFLMNGLVYNQVYIHWFWTLITMVYVLALVTDGARRSARSGSSAGATRTAGRRPVATTMGAIA